MTVNHSAIVHLKVSRPDGTPVGEILAVNGKVLAAVRAGCGPSAARVDFRALASGAPVQLTDSTNKWWDPDLLAAFHGFADAPSPSPYPRPASADDVSSWTAVHGPAAKAEGWWLSVNGAGKSARVQLQRLDEVGMFGSDVEAWVHVCDTEKTSPASSSALSLMGLHNLEELQRIRALYANGAEVQRIRRSARGGIPRAGEKTA
jgi:hypothetical protein